MGHGELAIGLKMEQPQWKETWIARLTGTTGGSTTSHVDHCYYWQCKLPVCRRLWVGRGPCNRFNRIGSFWGVWGWISPQVERIRPRHSGTAYLRWCTTYLREMKPSWEVRYSGERFWRIYSVQALLKIPCSFRKFL